MVERRKKRGKPSWDDVYYIVSIGAIFIALCIMSVYMVAEPLR